MRPGTRVRLYDEGDQMEVTYTGTSKDGYMTFDGEEFLPNLTENTTIMIPVRVVFQKETRTGKVRLTAVAR